LVYDALSSGPNHRADGSTTEQNYDEIGRMVGEKDGLPTTALFDAAGNRVSMI
jgi:YD repeat-containing protein